MPLPLNIVSLGVVALAGLFLLVSGLRLRRRGDTPRCGRCEYELTGLEAPERCPECGAELGDGADGNNASRVVYGERYRRPVVAITGAAVLLLLGVPLTRELVDQGRRYDWYRLRPTAWVLDDLATAQPLKSTRAARELNRRYASGSLARGGSNFDRYADLALVEQARPTPTGGAGPLQQDAVAFLSKAITRGELSADQAKRFHQNAVLLTLTATPTTVPPGGNVRYSIDRSCRVHGGTLWVQITREHARWDVDPGERSPDDDQNDVRGGGGYARMSGVGAGGKMSSSLPAPTTPGEHVLSVTARVAVFAGEMSENATPIEEHDVRLEAKVNVRADATAAPRVP